MTTPAPTRPVPRYREVADLLVQRIIAGELRPGERVPSERAIAAQHRLSRMTARQAVELLVRRGMVYRRPGSGTFVAPARIEHTLQRLLGFSEQMRAQGIEPGGRILHVRLERDVAADAAEALGLPSGESAWSVRRVRFGDGEPLLVEAFHVPEAIAPDLGSQDLAGGSLYEMLRRRYQVDPARAHETIEPTACESEDARHLLARPGAPAILVTRTTYDRLGRSIEYARDLYRGDRARFVIDLESPPS